MTNKVRLMLVTLWHPERFLGVLQALGTYPHILRDREEIEKRRIERTEQAGLQTWVAHFHDRPIINDGKLLERKTWLFTKTVMPAMEALQLRLIRTKNEGNQAQYRLEFRPEWDDDLGAGAEEMSKRVLNGIRSREKLSVRGLWLNPAGEDSIPHPWINLVLGPLTPDSVSKSVVAVDLHEEFIWVII